MLRFFCIYICESLYRQKIKENNFIPFIPFISFLLQVIFYGFLKTAKNMHDMHCRGG